MQPANNNMELLLQKLINDPALLKSIEKMAHQTLKLSLLEKKRLREQDRFGSISYLNKVIKTCKLCGSVSTFYSPMVWDKIEKLHRASCMSGILYEEWQDLEMRTLRQTTPVCDYCSEVLLHLPKEELIRKLMFHASRFV